MFPEIGFEPGEIRRTRLFVGLDIGDRNLAVLLVGNPDDGADPHPREAVDHLFDLPRIDVDPLGDDQVLFAVDNEEIPLLVHISHVPGQQPTVDDGLLRRLRTVEISLHDVVAL